MTTMEIVEERERIEAELSALDARHRKEREPVVAKLRALQKLCPHENVDHRGGGWWCKDCDWSR